MSLNLSILIFGILLVIFLGIRMIQNYRKQKRVVNTKDLVNVLFNVGLFTGGIASIIVSTGYGDLVLGSNLSIAQPIINFFAGILFIWFAIRNIFYEGKL